MPFRYGDSLQSINAASDQWQKSTTLQCIPNSKEGIAVTAQRTEDVMVHTAVQKACTVVVMCLPILQSQHISEYEGVDVSLSSKNSYRLLSYACKQYQPHTTTALTDSFYVVFRV